MKRAPLESRVGAGNDLLTRDPVEERLLDCTPAQFTKRPSSSFIHWYPTHLIFYFGLNLGVWQISPIRTSLILIMIGPFARSVGILPVHDHDSVHNFVLIWSISVITMVYHEDATILFSNKHVVTLMNTASTNLVSQGLAS
jgi:hypothetical protein